MNREDAAQFTHALGKLAEYFPGSKINLGVVAEGYFGALQHLSLDEVYRVFGQVVQECEFFPTVAHLRKLCGAPSVGDCPKCPGGHGTHTGHKVRHYPAGPWCETCQADMGTPNGYNYAQPAVAAPLRPMQLPQYGAAPLSAEEVEALVQGVVDQLGKLPELARMTPEERRACLKQQAEKLQHGTHKEVVHG